MKMEKKHWVMLIVGVVALYLVWYFFLRKKGTESSFDKNLMILGDQNSFAAGGGKRLCCTCTNNASCSGKDCKLVPCAESKYTGESGYSKPGCFAVYEWKEVPKGSGKFAYWFSGWDCPTSSV